MNFHLAILGSVILAVMPVCLLHLRGQYEILGKFLTLVGTHHTDARGNCLFYVQLKRGQFVTNVCQASRDYIGTTSRVEIASTSRGVR